MDSEEILTRYVERAKMIFEREIEIRTQTRINELVQILGLPLESVSDLWYGKKEVKVEMPPVSRKRGKRVHSS